MSVACDLAQLVATALEQADDVTRARIRDALGLSGGGAGEASATAPPAYTVATLAAELGVSAKVIRGAIARGELDAARRGDRYVISADAVASWAAPGRGDRSPPRVRRVEPTRSTRRPGGGRRGGPLAQALTALDGGE